MSRTRWSSHIPAGEIVRITKEEYRELFGEDDIEEVFDPEAVNLFGQKLVLNGTVSLFFEKEQLGLLATLRGSVQ